MLCSSFATEVSDLIEEGVPHDERLEVAQSALRRQRQALGIDSKKRFEVLKELENSLTSFGDSLQRFIPERDPNPEGVGREIGDLLRKPVLTILTDSESQQSHPCNQAYI